MRIPNIKFDFEEKRFDYDYVTSIVKKGSFAVLECAINYNSGKPVPDIYWIRENTFDENDGKVIRKLNTMESAIATKLAELSESDVFCLIDSYLDWFMVMGLYYIPMELMQLGRKYYIRGLICPESTIGLLDNR